MICRVADCGREVYARECCKNHYRRLRLYGDPEGRGTKRSGRRLNALGYIDVWEPAHPLARSDGYVSEHRKVVYDAGIEVPAGCHVHHKNGVKTDNRIENLAVIGASEHLQHHVEEAGEVVNQFGTFALRRDRAEPPRCLQCGSTDVYVTPKSGNRACRPCRNERERKKRRAA